MIVGQTIMMNYDEIMMKIMMKYDENMMKIMIKFVDDLATTGISTALKRKQLLHRCWIVDQGKML